MSGWPIFPIVLVFVVGHGFLVRWVASFFVSNHKKDVAGFSFILGMAYIAAGPINELMPLDKLYASTGYVMGIGIIWFLFFKKEKASACEAVHAHFQCAE
ncbi:MAG: hypothetical protein H6918_08050 [Sphingomonadaceae bacterium]|nr:hypothetical protein [Sphingomonadaceae bacterium]